MIRYGCPLCHATNDAADQYGGRTIHCPSCGETILLPAAAGPTPPTPTTRPSSRTGCAICRIALGNFGVHNFILGKWWDGCCDLFLGVLLVAILPLFLVLWGFNIFVGVRWLNMTDEQFAADVFPAKTV